LNATAAARQTAAVGFLDTIVKANSMYESKYQNGYAATIGQLGGVATAPATCDLSQMIDNSQIATMANNKQYVITYTPQGTALTTPAVGCTAAGFAGFLGTAVPLTVGASNSYCVDEKFTKHVDTTGGAAVTSESACDALPVL
jgi:hypothetical protein